MFLAWNLLASVRMFQKFPAPANDPVPGKALIEAIERRYGESGGERYGITPEDFRQIVAAVVARYASEAGETEQLELVAKLHVAELVLARACSAGNEAAWTTFLMRLRVPLYETACRITHDEAAGRELADGLYAYLYGMPNREGRRVSRLDYYMGRGSLEGWLRTVLSQEYVNRHRSLSREVSLDEQVEAGVSFAEPAVASAPEPDDRLSAAVAQTLTTLSDEERFLLASYYLDQRTLADIARQLRIHESTISRKLERLTTDLRKRVRKRLRAAGLDSRRCDELLQELDVRDLNVDVAANLRQDTPFGTFIK
jgi:RNA polymerase sigma-70 factor, ECF subfamily